MEIWLAAMGFGLLALFLKTNRLAVFIGVNYQRSHYLGSNFLKMIYNNLLIIARKKTCRFTSENACCG